MTKNNSEINTKSKVVTRFAPSPTGFMHIGGVRTALYSYLFAKKMGGTFILRIEDTDKEREVEGSINHIVESLKWLGIDWDFGPEKATAPFGSCIQSERLDIYKEFADRLVEKGLAYPDPYTEEEISKFKLSSEENKKPFLFRNHRPKVFDKWDGKKTLRFKVPEIKRYKWNDLVRGQLEAGEEALDDFVLIKSDGFPTYNFAHIIDDHLMGVTHVLRGDEFISSTPKFLSLYDALEIRYPTFVTLPPILRDDKTKKLGKRDGAKDILEYKREGYLPEAMVNFLAFIGWNPGTEKEIFSMSELIESFDLGHIQKGGATSNEEKLLWFNKEHIKTLSTQKKIDILKAIIISSEKIKLEKWILDDVIISKIVDTVFERINIFSDIDKLIEIGDLDFYFKSPTYNKELLLWKDCKDIYKVKVHLNNIKSIVEEMPESMGEESIKALIWPYADSSGRGEVLWPLRISLSGKDKSPNPFALISILGKAESLKRITDAINKII